MALSTSNLLGRIAAIAAAVAALLATSAWVFYADDRRPSHSARVGTLAVELPEGSGRGTAFLVDECGILTNFHVVFGPWTVTALRPPSHDFTGTFTLTEVTLPDGSHPSARATPVVWGDYLGPDRQLRRPEEDWAYLTLDTCLGRQYGYFELREADLYEPAVEQGFTAIGYSTGRQMADPGCLARADASAGGKGWLHDCALLPGDSGAPVFRASTLIVVALGSGHRAKGSDGACLAADPGAGDDPLFAWGRGCANVAVPITTAIREQVLNAEVAVDVQRQLAAMGRDTGTLGAIDSAQAIAAFQQLQREMGWDATGEPAQ
jgi:V8-like Glu-specific endopeptidase